MMDISTNEVITWVAGLSVSGFVKYLHSRMNKIDARHDALAKDFSTHKELLPTQFVHKDDYRVDLAEIKTDLKALVQHVIGASRGS